MARRLSTQIATHLLRRSTAGTACGGLSSHLYHHFTTNTIPKNHHSLISLLDIHSQPAIPFTLRSFSTLSRRRPDIGARARQLQTRRLWTYALTFSCVAGFIVIVLNQFQDQLVFYVTPSEALSKYSENPAKSKFRLGGLVLEGSVSHVPSSPEMQFVITDLITDILVKYEGSLPDLFREGHSVVVEGFVKPFTEDIRRKDEEVLGKNKLGVTGKARSGVCYFAATEVLAKHDEKYMPKEVAAAIEKNKIMIAQQEQEEEKVTTNVTAKA